MKKYNSGKNISNFYFIQLNSNDTIYNWKIMQDDFYKKIVINVLI
jgi:hypothetical protein